MSEVCYDYHVLQTVVGALDNRVSLNTVAQFVLLGRKLKPSVLYAQPAQWDPNQVPQCLPEDVVCFMAQRLQQHPWAIIILWNLLKRAIWSTTPFLTIGPLKDTGVDAIRDPPLLDHVNKACKLGQFYRISP